jgi:hypothetical protein
MATGAEIIQQTGDLVVEGVIDVMINKMTP